MSTTFGLLCRTKSCQSLMDPWDTYTEDVTIGCGNQYPVAYEGNLKAARNGFYGESMRRFLADHPDGAIDMLQVALCCPACHSVSSRLDLSMYLPVDSSVKPQDGKSWAYYHPENAGYMYVNPYDLENPKLYRLFALYEHKCEKCGHQMEIIKGKDFIRLRNECMKENKPSPFKCRRCGEDLWFTNEEMDWD